MNPHTTIFFGPSGAGKGTQAKLLCEYLTRNDPSRNTLLYGTGALVREFIENDTNYTSTLVKDIIDTGKLLPSFIPIWFWSNFLIENYTGKEHLIFDGTRRVLEVTALDTALSFYDRRDAHVIALDVSKEWSIARLKERGRADDKEMEIESRLSWYEKEVIPAINFFRERDGYTVHDINGEQTIEEVHEDILKALNLKQ